MTLTAQLTNDVATLWMQTKCNRIYVLFIIDGKEETQKIRKIIIFFS